MNPYFTSGGEGLGASLGLSGVSPVEAGIFGQLGGLAMLGALQSCPPMMAYDMTGLQNALQSPLQKARDYAADVRKRNPSMQVRRITPC